MKLDLAFVPPAESRDVAVVIDVLRMTTTATTLFSRGLSELTVVARTDEALELASRTGALLLGERDGLPFPGFDGGNSPLEQLSVNHSGKSAILCTSNGSKAVEAANRARHILLGAIVNASAVARRSLELAEKEITLLCAGTHGKPSLDDVLGAGCIAAAILRLAPETETSDAAKLALELADSRGGIAETLQKSLHATTLQALGFDEDIEFAAKLDSIDFVGEKFAAAPARFRVAP